jgi:PAS domain S-box-containing protein
MEAHKDRRESKRPKARGAKLEQLLKASGQTEVLLKIAAGTTAVTGGDFFRSLVANLASALKVRYIYLSELLEPERDRFATLAVWEDGGLRENFEYDLAGTPCGEVVRTGQRYFLQNVQQTFPHNHFLKEKQVESYCGTPLLDRSGRVLGVLNVLHDQPMSSMADIEPIITIFADRATAELERKRAEDSLEHSRALLKSFVEHTPAAVAMFDKNLRYVAVSQRWVHDYKLGDRDIIGRHHYDVFPEIRQRQDWQDIHQRCLAGAVERREEDCFVRADGNKDWLRWEVRPWRDESGAIGGVIMFTEVVSERKRAEEALRESQGRFMSFMEHLPGVAFIKDQQGHHLYANKAFEMLLRLEPGAWQGKTNDQLFPPDIASQFTANDRTVLASGQALEVAEVTQTDQGTQHWLSVKFPILAKDGAPAMLGGIAVNVTEQKRLEEQLRQAQKMEAVGRLAGGVAHDFNNLLTVITGYSELLLARMTAGETGHRQVQEIKKAADRASSLTAQLLAFSRRQPVEPREVDLSGVVSNMADMLRRLIGEDVRLVTRLEEALGLVKIDPAQLEQVIMNLAVNARDAMPQGGTLTIETADVSRAPAGLLREGPMPEGPLVRLTVQDTGLGMDAETLSHVFEPFFTTKEPGKGTGLGLATVYGIITQGGGTIRAVSEPGRGTTFTIYLPQVATARKTAQASAAPAAALSGSETILLVEDESAVRQFVSEILVMNGYRVLEAANGDEALRLCESYQGPIDLLLTDIVMPGMRGTRLEELAVVVRRQMKVVFMSGYMEDSEVVIGSSFLHKPFTPGALARMMREVLDAPHERHET